MCTKQEFPADASATFADEKIWNAYDFSGHWNSGKHFFHFPDENIVNTCKSMNFEQLSFKTA